jgi:hypothetical protein
VLTLRLPMAGRAERTSDLDHGGNGRQPDVHQPDPGRRLMSGPFHSATITPPASTVIGCEALPGLLPRE